MAKRRRRTAARGGSLSSFSIEQIRAELDRRVGALAQEEAALAARLDELRAQISGAGPGGGARRGVRGGRRGRRRGRGGAAGAAAPGRRRARNKLSLREALHAALQGKTMGINEVADAVRSAGYKTKSPNFRTMVNQTLLNRKLFKRMGRGQYTAA